MASKWLNDHITGEISKNEYDIIHYLKSLVREEKRKGKQAEVSNYKGAFEKIWAIYPRKVAKAAAFKTFAKAIKGIKPENMDRFCSAMYNSIIRRIKWWDDHDTEIQYIPYLSTYINKNYLIDV